MIPVRVPADLKVHTVGGVRRLEEENPLFYRDCPVCDTYLLDEPITLVAVGIRPDDRKERGWTTGGAIAVHVACVGAASVGLNT
ncbi:MAG TPA: hypothetical protein VGL32_07090 [Acidimicrobiales bacterium]|jgi:hypothetical protein